MKIYPDIEIVLTRTTNIDGAALSGDLRILPRPNHLSRPVGRLREWEWCQAFLCRVGVLQT